MTVTNGGLGPVIYQVYVNGVKYNQQPPVLDAQLVQEYGKHDMMYLRIEYPPGSNLTSLSVWPDDTPLMIYWGRSPDIMTWYGYVNHHEIAGAADSGSNNPQVTYVGIGTSMVLNADVNRRWEQVSPTYIAKKIAFENGLRPVVTPIRDYELWPLNYEVQVNESDFHFLNRMADRTGMRFWCSGGSLYMVSPDVALTGGGQTAPPVYTMNKAIGTLDTCRNFRYLKGKNLPGSVQANRVIYGIDKASNNVFAASTQPRSKTTRVAAKTTAFSDNYTDASQRIKGWSKLSQFWIGATALLYGNTSLYPGKLVNLQGLALPDNAPGYWLVTKTTHTMVQSVTANAVLDVYMTGVTLLRNEEKVNTVVLTNIDPVVPEFTAMTLNPDYLWIATDRSAVVL